MKSDAHIETQIEEKKEDQTREETADQVENQLEEMIANQTEDQNEPLNISLIEGQFDKDLDRFLEVETPQNSYGDVFDAPKQEQIEETNAGTVQTSH